MSFAYILGSVVHAPLLTFQSLKVKIQAALFACISLLIGYVYSGESVELGWEFLT